jgi:hypothetical protein
VAKEFGAGSPMHLARQYGLLRPDFCLSAEETILADNHLLNRLIEAENKARAEAIEKRDLQKRMPGVTRMVSAPERSEQLKRMRAKK